MTHPRPSSKLEVSRQSRKNIPYLTITLQRNEELQNRDFKAVNCGFVLVAGCATSQLPLPPSPLHVLVSFHEFPNPFEASAYRPGTASSIRGASRAAYCRLSDLKKTLHKNKGHNCTSNYLVTSRRSSVLGVHHQPK